jgi:4-hydroxybenzoate polyprenyltransferase
VLLGSSGGFASLLSVPAQPQLWVAIGMGVYVAGITWFARTEAKASSRNMLFAAMVIINLGLASLMAWVLNWPYGGDPTATMFVLLVVALMINRKLTLALSDPQPKAVQLAVKTMILSIITLDAALIYARSGQPGAWHALAVVLLLVPCILLSKWIKVT